VSKINYFADTFGAPEKAQPKDYFSDTFGGNESPPVEQPPIDIPSEQAPAKIDEELPQGQIGPYNSPYKTIRQHFADMSHPDIVVPKIEKSWQPFKFDKNGDLIAPPGNFSALYDSAHELADGNFGFSNLDTYMQGQDDAFRKSAENIPSLSSQYEKMGKRIKKGVDLVAPLVAERLKQGERYTQNIITNALDVLGRKALIPALSAVGGFLAKFVAEIEDPLVIEDALKAGGDAYQRQVLLAKDAPSTFMQLASRDPRMTMEGALRRTAHAIGDEIFGEDSMMSFVAEDITSVALSFVDPTKPLKTAETNITAAILGAGLSKLFKGANILAGKYAPALIKDIPAKDIATRMLKVLKNPGEGIHREIIERQVAKIVPELTANRAVASVIEQIAEGKDALSITKAVTNETLAALKASGELADKVTVFEAVRSFFNPLIAKGEELFPFASPATAKRLLRGHNVLGTMTKEEFEREAKRFLIARRPVNCNTAIGKAFGGKSFAEAEKTAVGKMLQITNNLTDADYSALNTVRNIISMSKTTGEGANISSIGITAPLDRPFTSYEAHVFFQEGLGSLKKKIARAPEPGFLQELDESARAITPDKIKARFDEVFKSWDLKTRETAKQLADELKENETRAEELKDWLEKHENTPENIIKTLRQFKLLNKIAEASPQIFRAAFKTTLTVLMKDISKWGGKRGSVINPFSEMFDGYAAGNDITAHADPYELPAFEEPKSGQPAPEAKPGDVESPMQGEATFYFENNKKLQATRAMINGALLDATPEERVGLYPECIKMLSQTPELGEKGIFASLTESVKGSLKSLFGLAKESDAKMIALSGRDIILSRVADRATAMYDADKLCVNINNLVPNEDERIAISFLMEKTGPPIGASEGVKAACKNPTPKMIVAARMIRHYFKIGWRGLEGLAGETFGRRVDYVPHDWELGEIESNQFMKQRSVATLKEGIDSGLVPKTTDIAHLLKLWGSHAANAFFKLGAARDLAGLAEQGITVIGDADKMPKDWPIVNHSALNTALSLKKSASVRVHPEIFRAVNVIFGQKFTMPVTVAGKRFDLCDAITYIGGLLKTAKLGLSTFHPLALAESAVSTDIVKTAKLLNPVKLWDAVVNGKHEIYESGIGRDAVEHNVQLGEIQEYQIRSLNQLLRFVSNSFEKLGMPGKVVALAPKGLEKTKDSWDFVLWKYLHTNFKLFSYESQATHLLKLKESNGWFGRLLGMRGLTADQLKREVGQWTNDSFGGQNFETLMLNPKWRQFLGWTFLSADWVASTMRQALGVTGLGAVHSKRVRSYLATRFWVKAGVIFYTLGNMINYYNTRRDYGEGRYLWENPDEYSWYPYLYSDENGQPTHLMWGKQFRELPEFIENFSRKLGSKASILLQMASAFFTGKTLGGYEEPELRDIQNKTFLESLGTRLKFAITAALVPISFESSTRHNDLISLVLPIKKGMTKNQVIDNLANIIQNGTREELITMMRFCSEAGYSPGRALNSAVNRIKASLRKEDSLAASRIFKRVGRERAMMEVKNPALPTGVRKALAMIIAENLSAQKEVELQKERSKR